MKKLLFLSLAFFVFTTGAKSQTVTPVTDTVHYYYLKHYYKWGTSIGNMPFFKAPSLTNVSHLGSKFESNDTSLVITGLEGILGRTVRSSQATTPGRLYLCELDATGMPKLPPIDSVSFTLSRTLHSVLGIIGGDFPDGRTHKMSKNYAVLIRNMQSVSGDTIMVGRTNSRTYTLSPTDPSFDDRLRYSDGNGVVRAIGKFNSTTDYTLSGFGKTTDYEFCLAPRVKYDLVASQILPDKVINKEKICTWDAVTFTNTSSWAYTNRMYNFLEFTRKWNQHAYGFFLNYIQPVGGFTGDTAISWFFRDQDNGSMISDARKFLPFQQGSGGTITHISDSAGCFNDCHFVARHRKMSLQSSVQTAVGEYFEICVDYCEKDALSIKKNGADNSIHLYPNPTSSEKTTITGLEDNAIIYVYDLLGQLVVKETADKERTTIDLSKHPNGTYFVRVINDNKKVQTVKIVKQD